MEFPLSVWNLHKEDKLAFFEAGISKPGEMDILGRIIQPQIGLFTNIGEAHQVNFKDYEEKIDEKLLLFEDSNLIVYCKDHILIDRKIKEKYSEEKKFFTWCYKKNNKSDVKVIEKVNWGNKTTVTLEYHNEDFEFQIPFSDYASFENAMHVFCVSIALGEDPTIACKKMIYLSPVAMRLEQKKGINRCTIINDSYNSDPASLKIALDVLSQQHQHNKKTLIISDILQTGHTDDDLYENVKNLLRNYKIDRLIGIGGAISDFADTFEISEKSFYKDTTSFLIKFNRSSFENEAILLKGSRIFEFERINRLLEERGHRTVLEINLNNLVNNLNYFRGLVKAETKIMAMVKAFGYGSGASEISNVLQFQRIDYLGVAFADEGVSLRSDGIKIPIVVMNPEINSFDSMIDNNLEPQIFNIDQLMLFNAELRGKNIKNYPVHLKIDTGMHRSGIEEKDLHLFFKEIKRAENIKIASVFSHLAASDERQHDGFTKNQILIFDKISSLIHKELGYSFLRHILNSAGIERFPEYQFDMVRVGIGLYGISINEPEKVLPVSKLKSYISQIREVDPNETVGYGRKGEVERKSKIAVVPVGYADGLRRSLSNGFGQLWVNGSRANIVGNICMDMCMIDITSISAREGDDVEIFGDNISISEIAGKLKTIPYEVLTGISPRVKRVYFQE